MSNWICEFYCINYFVFISVVIKGLKYGPCPEIDRSRINPDAVPPHTDHSKLWNVQLFRFVNDLLMLH